MVKTKIIPMKNKKESFLVHFIGQYFVIQLIENTVSTAKFFYYIKMGLLKSAYKGNASLAL